MGQTFDKCSICPAPAKDQICSVCTCKRIEPARPPRPDFSGEPPAVICSPAYAERRGDGTVAPSPDFVSRGSSPDGHRADCKVLTPPISGKIDPSSGMDFAPAYPESAKLLEGAGCSQPPPGHHVEGFESVPLSAGRDRSRRHSKGRDGRGSSPPPLEASRIPPESGRLATREDRIEGIESVPLKMSARDHLLKAGRSAGSPPTSDRARRHPKERYDVGSPPPLRKGTESPPGSVRRASSDHCVEDIDSAPTRMCALDQKTKAWRSEGSPPASDRARRHSKKGDDIGLVSPTREDMKSSPGSGRRASRDRHVEGIESVPLKMCALDIDSYAAEQKWRSEPTPSPPASGRDPTRRRSKGKYDSGSPPPPLEASKSPPESGRRATRDRCTSGSGSAPLETSPRDSDTTSKGRESAGTASAPAFIGARARDHLKALGEIDSVTPLDFGKIVSAGSGGRAKSPAVSGRRAASPARSGRAPGSGAPSPPGSGRHSAAAAILPSSVAVRRCVVCPEGTRCRRQRDIEHLAQEAHPFDPGYTEVCKVIGVTPEEPSLKGLFEWVDVDDSGKISLKELEGALPLLEMLWGEPVHMSKKSWERLDEDGNGCVNFSEFAAWAGPRLGLPLGVKHLFPACSILGCPCEKFEVKPSKKGVVKSVIAKRRPQICRCGHKSCCHNDVHRSGLEIPYPSYWDMKTGDFSSLVPADTSMLRVFQKLLDETYKNTFTRDRKRHNPDAPNVPKSYQVVRAWRSENSKYWQEYSVRRAELSKSQTDAGPGEAFPQFTDVKSVNAWLKFAGSAADRLKPECNEWYVFHGTSPQAAEMICAGDFKICLAGSSTGTLYGRGCYFSESITKADEYAKANADGERALLLCRALGGRVRYTADVEPDPEDLTESCIEGPYDCILGDREKCRGTFREFVFYDTENVYAEYVIHYKRIY